MSLYTDEIKKLVDTKIPVVPYTLLVRYLQKAYGLSQYAAEEAVYSAARARQITMDENTQFIMRPKKPKVDSQTTAKAKAFAVVTDFLPDSMEFCAGSTPWTYVFLRGGKIYQIAYMKRGDEFGQSHIITQQPVALADRDNFVRILVVEPNVDFSKILMAGYQFYCTVDENNNYSINVIEKIPPEKAWADVRER